MSRKQQTVIMCLFALNTFSLFSVMDEFPTLGYLLLLLEISLISFLLGFKAGVGK